MTAWGLDDTEVVDPFYECPAARWVVDLLEQACNITVLVDESLAYSARVNRKKRIVRVRPGLVFESFRQTVGNGALYIDFPEAATGFGPPRPALCSMHGETLQGPWAPRIITPRDRH